MIWLLNFKLKKATKLMTRRVYVVKANIVEYSQNIKNKKTNKNKLGPKGGVSKE